MKAGKQPETGSAAVELTILTPLLILILVLIVAFGRVALAHQAVDGAARDGARAASLSRSVSGAKAAGRTTAQSSLQTGRLSCRTDDVAVDTSQFRPGGWVAVDVTCRTSLADLSLLHLPATKEIHGRVVAPVDTFRAAS